MVLKRRSVFLGLLLSGLFLIPSGCGYTRHNQMPEGMKTIYVEPVKNKMQLEDVYAYVPGLEILITNEIVKRLNEDGNMRVVGTPEEADVVLKTNLKALQQDGVRFTRLESIEEYRMFLVTALELVNTKTKQVIWEESEFSGDAEYFVGDIRSTAREEAAERAAKRLARNITDRIVEDW